MDQGSDRNNEADLDSPSVHRGTTGLVHGMSSTSLGGVGHTSRVPLMARPPGKPQVHAGPNESKENMVYDFYDKDDEPALVVGNGTEAGHTISTTVAGRNGQPKQQLFQGETGVDQLIEIIKIIGTPTREEIKCMNPNYSEYKFPQIKAHPWHKVFDKRMPPEAVDLVSRLLQYSPKLCCTALEACAHPFFDDLRDPSASLPNGRPLPPLFNFTAQELSGALPDRRRTLVPEHAMD